MRNARGRWRETLRAAVLWALVYNALWGLAWFGYMRGEWARAAVSLNRPMPWTAVVWFGWIALTVPMGVLVGAYVASQSRPFAHSGLYASTAMAILMTAGMSVWALQDGYSFRVVALDSVVNASSLLLAGVACGGVDRLGI
jgi:hypothetical protein